MSMTVKDLKEQLESCLRNNNRNIILWTTQPSDLTGG